MNKFIAIALLFFLSGLVFGQKPLRPQTKPSAPAKKPASKPKPAPIPTPVDPAVEKAKLDEALAFPSAAEKAVALAKLLTDFPASEQKGRVLESLVTARAILGDEKLQVNDNSAGVALFKLAVEEAPTPIPERLFNEIVSKFPANLFYRDQRAAALEIAEAIEKKAAGNAKQLLNLATFYLGIESGSDAKRLAEAAIVIDPASVTAYQTLGLSHRLNFDLEESARAYSKAMELDGGSVTSKRSLAEMKRALAKPDEAAVLYREIVAANENDAAARTGLILSLFGDGKKSEAESELTKSLEQNPKNLNLLAGAAYWYAANDLGDRAVELAQKAVELEPRYIWGHIALARGLISQKKPVEAERVLVMARQHGNFPTLEYEIASARLMSGFYREAVEELQKSFTLKDGLVQSKLGGRVSREEKSFADLIAYERRASIFEPSAADNPETAAKLKLLFEITQKLNGPNPDEAELSALTDEFVKGDDKMKLHRQMYSATLLLQKNVALPKVLELARAAVGNAEAGLEVSTPAAAVMASELYESRTVAFARNEIIVVPEVPRQTLSAILRGRIEELTGWTLYQQKSYPEAVVRLRRAVSVLPDKSAWWRSSMWRLGAALEADGKDKESLDSYIQSYKTDRPSVYRYIVVESLYKKVHGNIEGLEAKIGPNPLQTAVTAEPVKPPETSTKPAESTRTQPEVIVEKSDPLISTEVKIDKVSPLETPVKTVENSPTKIVDAVNSDNKTDTKTQVSEVPVKMGEIPEPKIEKASTTAILEDTNPKNPEVPIKTIEIVEPKVENAATAEKRTETIVPDADTASKAEDEVRPKTETQKPEISPQVPPVVESVKKTESDVPIEPSPALSVPAANDKPVEKVETASSQPQPKTEVPVTTDPSSDAPKNLLRDPLSNAEPEPAEPQSEKPVKPEGDLKPASPPEKKPLLIISDPLGEGKKTDIKDIFEPVIIRIPGSLPQKSVAKEPEKPSETDDTLKGESDKDPKTQKKPADDAVSSGASRVRVVDGKEITSDAQCSLEISQDNVSLINGGGSLGILVRIVGEGDFTDIVTTSSSPKDVEVKAEPEMTGVSGRRFYLIKSVSTDVGIYQVTFESRCGKKEIIVKVR